MNDQHLHSWLQTPEELKTDTNSFLNAKFLAALFIIVWWEHSMVIMQINKMASDGTVLNLRMKNFFMPKHVQINKVNQSKC